MQYIQMAREFKLTSFLVLGYSEIKWHGKGPKNYLKNNGFVNLSIGSMVNLYCYTVELSTGQIFHRSAFGVP
jgi:hypothetical protein